jgi:hypothetical protein
MQSSNKPYAKTWTIQTGISHRVLLIDDQDGHAVGEYVDCRRRSDAQLITAAPGLLEACRAALQALTSSHDESHFDALALETMLTAAIARAQGGSDE